MQPDDIPISDQPPEQAAELEQEQDEQDDGEQDQEFEFPGLSATYSPEDNKLRVTLGQYLSKPDFRKLKERLYSAGFSWAPKQELFVCPRWTPTAEDLLLELCGDIGDEDYSIEERAADRAERFSGYRDKRRDEAGDHADTFQAGPSAFGHQNLARAERQARRHDRHRAKALNQWGKAEYWQIRTAGVIRHALHKTSASVRRGRILTLEAEQRKHQKSIDEAIAKYKTWEKIAAEPDAELATKAATNYAGYSTHWDNFKHPRQDKTSSLWSLLTMEQDPITGHEAARMYLENCSDPADPDGYWHRWIRHYELRLDYEKAMATEEGGLASEVEMEPGGWIGKRQIHGVVKSPVTGRVTSVKLMLPARWHQDDGDGKLSLRAINIERLGAEAYRPPTDEERAAFAVETKERKAKEKAERPKEAPTINPTDGDAELLQALWNARAKLEHAKKSPHSTFVPSEVLKITQKVYSDNSKGEYSSFEIRSIDEEMKPHRRSTNLWTSEGHKYDETLKATVCKIRLRSVGSWYSPPRVVVLTDKPQKPIPTDWQKHVEALTGKAVETAEAT